MSVVTLGAGSSESMIPGDEGRSEYYQNKQRRDVLAAELHAAMELLWGGSGKVEKQMRLRVFEHIFGFRTKEAADAASLSIIERGVRILQAFEQRVAKEKKLGNELLTKTEDEILTHLEIDIREYDEGTAADQDLPF
jgi:hypothetical protein